MKKTLILNTEVAPQSTLPGGLVFIARHGNPVRITRSTAGYTDNECLYSHLVDLVENNKSNFCPVYKYPCPGYKSTFETFSISGMGTDLFLKEHFSSSQDGKIVVTRESCPRQVPPDCSRVAILNLEHKRHTR